MVDDQLLISELAEKAGVSVRTIRFYINEGLLPPPEGRGRYSVYDEEYLTRIELIKRLKSAYLPLKEIKRMVESLTKAEVESMLHNLSEPPSQDEPAAPQAPAVSGSPKMTSSGKPGAVKESGLPEALNYIARVLHSQAAPPALAAAPPAPRPLSQAARPLARVSQGDESRSIVPDQAEENESSWRRYTIQPGVELLVSEQVYARSASSIHAIVAQIKQMFSTQ